ncbi:hypothetical protein TNCV_1689641 [Trichonephila clavipes]|nr:hypothetical protein TNCV_1689641 [Trichonephila clavipes]
MIGNPGALRSDGLPQRPVVKVLLVYGLRAMRELMLCVPAYDVTMTMSTIGLLKPSSACRRIKDLSFSCPMVTPPHIKVRIA